MLRRKVKNKIKEIIDVFMDFINFSNLIKDEEKGKLVILISHSADSSGGAPVVLYEYAKYLEKEGKKVVFLSDRRGILIFDARKNNIAAFETSFLYRVYLRKIKNQQKKINYMVINTVTLYKYLSYLSILKYEGKILWWIHESKGLIENYSRYIKTYNLKRIAICCVSSKVIKNIEVSLKNKVPNLYLLPYGIKDRGYFEDSYFNNDFSITIIGRVTKRKNQIELVKAFKCLPSKIKNKVSLQIVAGSIDDNYLEDLKNVIQNDERIKIVGPFDRSDMKKVYKYSQVIVSSSEDDPLPVVISESMMYGRIIIVSSGNGQFDYIENGITGFKYITGNYKELSHIIEYVLLNFDKMGNIRKNARNLFEKIFSIDGMNKNVSRILKKM